MEKDSRNSIEIGQRLRELRTYYGLKQEEFGDRIKVHQSSIALFEAGKRYLKDIYVKLICDEFEINSSWLLYGEGNMIKPRQDISFREYARVHKLSALETEILSDFMELRQETKKENLDSFIKVVLGSRQKAK